MDGMSYLLATNFFAPLLDSNLMIRTSQGGQKNKASPSKNYPEN